MMDSRCRLDFAAEPMRRRNGALRLRAWAIGLLIVLSAVAWAGDITYEYDDAGRLRKVTYPNLSVRKYVLDPAGNRVLLQTLDPPPSFSIVDKTIDEGAGMLSLTVTLAPASALTYKVNYTTAAGSASANSDFTAQSGTLSFGANEGSQVINIPITSDAVYEGAEVFTVTLSAPTNEARLIKSVATVTINDDDPAPSFSIADQSFDETVGSASITVLKSGATQLAHAVSYATSNGTASAGSDYTATSGTLSFAAGESTKTFSVAITNDSILESSETFRVMLSGPSGGATLANTIANITIVQAPDSIAPSVPTGLVILPESPTELLVAWNPSTDTGGAGLAGYKVLRNGVPLGTTPLSNYTDSTVLPSTTYTYAIQAYDAAVPANVSAASVPIMFTTPSAAVPGTPQGFIVQVSPTRVTLHWNPVVGATRYEVYDVDFGRFYSGTDTTISRSGVAGLVFSFYVQACNANGCGSPTETITVGIPCDPKKPNCNLN